MINNNKINENISSYSEINDLNYHTDVIQCIKLLKNNYLISCSNDGSLIIYKKDSFEFILQIRINDYWIYYLIENYNNDIIFCSADCNIYVININFDIKFIKIKQIIKAHKASVYKVIEFKKKLISISIDQKIIIYNNNNGFYDIETIIKNSIDSECIITITKTNQIISTFSFENSIKFIDFYTLKNKYVFNGFNVGYYNSIISKNEEKNLIFITGTKRTENGITIINFISYNILAEIKFYDDGFINSLYYLNNDFLLVGKKIGDYVYAIKYKIEKNEFNYTLIEYGKIKVKSNEKIRTILIVNNYILLGCENIKIFSLK
jgi:WD40 repeat protein